MAVTTMVEVHREAVRIGQLDHTFDP